MATSAPKNTLNSADEMRLRRQAVQIVAQLPEDTGDALAVLGYASELVEKFLAREATTIVGNVLPLFGG